MADGSAGDFERHVEKLRAIGYKEGFLSGLDDTVERRTIYEQQGFLMATKVYTLIRVLLQHQPQDDTADGIKLPEFLIEDFDSELSNEKSKDKTKKEKDDLFMRSLLDIHAFSPDRLAKVLPWEILAEWPLILCLKELLRLKNSPALIHLSSDEKLSLLSEMDQHILQGLTQIHGQVGLLLSRFLENNKKSSLANDLSDLRH
jgi:hypothetical protein